MPRTAVAPTETMSFVVGRRRRRPQGLRVIAAVGVAAAGVVAFNLFYEGQPLSLHARELAAHLPGGVRPAVGEGDHVEEGARYRGVVRGHCGVRSVDFAGRAWTPLAPVPAAARDTGIHHGVLSLENDHSVLFRADAGWTLAFTPRGHGQPPPGMTGPCA